MSKLVSIIIPCFNAERWIVEAIESCLNQTYASLEIIVVDDGSTDGSLSLIQSFGAQITWVTGPNHGGNHARNKGFSISHGDYIQYLDADDYLCPDKISRQVQHLESEGSDLVYGDWRYQNHKIGGRVVLEDVQVSGLQADMIESLLGLWWVATACPLYRRRIVEQVGGWDESLLAAQDRDFLLSVMMAGARATYQPGCVSVYRRYGNVTVSTASMTQFVESHLKVLQKTEQKLLQQGRLNENYHSALARSHFSLARFSLRDSFSKYTDCLEKTLAYRADFQAEKQLAMTPAFRESGLMASLYHRLQRQFGFKKTEAIFCGVLKLKLNWDAWSIRFKQVVKFVLDKLFGKLLGSQDYSLT